MNWTDYNKLIGYILGGVIGLAMVWTATKIPGVVTCTIPTDHETCKILNTFDYQQVYSFAWMLLSFVGVYRSKANTIAGKTAVPSE